VPFSRELYIEQEDFLENPPPKYFRLYPGGMVRLKSAYIVQCTGVQKDDQGRIAAVLCEYFPQSRSGQDISGLRVKGTIHWLSAPHAVTAEVRLYDRLFCVEDPASEEDFRKAINPDSLEIIPNAFIEPSLKETRPGDSYQFTRLGYFCTDPDSTAEKPVFNRTVTLKDTWAKEAQKQA
jgi:glutaminyl-tRNA synthetase